MVYVRCACACACACAIRGQLDREHLKIQPSNAAEYKQKLLAEEARLLEKLARMKSRQEFGLNKSWQRALTNFIGKPGDAEAGAEEEDVDASSKAKGKSLVKNAGAWVLVQ